MHFIVPFFFASIVEFSSLSGDKGPESELAGRALSGIRKIATIVFETESPQSMCRLVWPLFIAGAETPDFVHQNWVLQCFVMLRDFGVSYSRAYDVLKKVIAEQRLTNKRVDYRQLIEAQAEFSAFVI